MSMFFLRHPRETDLALFAGGEAGPLARWRIEKHIGDCPQCEEAVADFFRLQEEIEVLAETPALDWEQLAGEIRVQAAAARSAESPRGATGLAAGRWAWGAGLAAAAVISGLVIVRQAPQNDASPERQTVAAVEAVRQDAGTAAKEEPTKAESEPQVADQLLAARRESAASAGQTEDFGGRADKQGRARRTLTELPADLPAAPSPPAFADESQPLRERKAVPLEQQAELAEARQQSEREVVRIAAEEAADGAEPDLRYEQAPAAAPNSKADAAGESLPQRGFSFLPATLSDPTASLDVAADGGMSLRAFDAETGTLTITDVYAP